MRHIEDCGDCHKWPLKAQEATGPNEPGHGGKNAMFASVLSSGDSVSKWLLPESSMLVGRSMSKSIRGRATARPWLPRGRLKMLELGSFRHDKSGATDYCQIKKLPGYLPCVTRNQSLYRLLGLIGVEERFASRL